MKISLQFFCGMLLAGLGMLFTGTPIVAADNDETILIGQITHVEGKLLRYIEEEKDWVGTVKDSPFGLDDALYSGDEGKAEIIMPNKTWFRVSGNTQFQLIALDLDATTVDVASGLARFYNKSEDAVIKVTTPYGYVVAPAGTVFDLYVGDESLEVIAVRGNVDFVHDKSKSRYEVWEGASSLIADDNETALGNGMVDSQWDDWNGRREDIWAQRLRSTMYSDLLPEPIRDNSYVLDENGEWERVYYEGTYRDMWRPTRIDSGWRPFTAGRWTVYYGDNCWIPDEPFGYVTHHYGSWVYVDSSRNWYWMPPTARFVESGPRFSISFGWYPGRVGWLHSGPSIGWVPLAPDEDYYGYRHWGRRTVIVSNTSIVNINIGRYRYIDEVTIVHRDHFYSGKRYTPYIQRNIDRDVIINNYQPTTVINTTIINNINIDKRRHTYNDLEVTRKPHTMAINRINDNQQRKREFGPAGRERIEKDLMRVNAKAEPSPNVEVRKPRLATKLVDSDQVAKPFNTLALEKKEIKPRDRERPISTEKAQRLGTKGKGESGQIEGARMQDDKRPAPATKDTRNQRFEQADTQPPAQEREKQRWADEQTQRGEAGDADKKSPKQRLKSPREAQNQGTETGNPSQEWEKKQSRENALPKIQEQSPQPATKLQSRKPQEPQKREQTPAQRGDKENWQKNSGAAGEPIDRNQEDKPRLKSPREANTKETNQPDQLRQKADNQLQKEQKMRLQPEEGQRLQEQELKQQKVGQQRQEQDLQKRQQQEEQRQLEKESQLKQQKQGQQRQEQELQKRQQQEEQRQLEKESQLRQQKEGQQRQEQELQKRQQQEEQRRLEKESQLRQQKQGQQRQEQELQKRQQQEEQRRLEKESQLRQQKEGQRRQEQELQKRQQQEEQRRLEKESQLRQQKQEAEQRPPQEAKQLRQKQDEPPKQQEQKQPVKQKNKTKQQEEEEEAQRQQQQKFPRGGG